MSRQSCFAFSVSDASTAPHAWLTELSQLIIMQQSLQSFFVFFCIFFGGKWTVCVLRMMKKEKFDYTSGHRYIDDICDIEAARVRRIHDVNRTKPAAFTRARQISLPVHAAWSLINLHAALHGALRIIPQFVGRKSSSAAGKLRASWSLTRHIGPTILLWLGQPSPTYR